MKKSFIVGFIISFYISSIYAASDGIGEYSISKEINKLIPIAAKGTKDYKWSCETVSNMSVPIGMEQGRHITDKCLVETDIGQTFKITCEYAILPETNGATECRLGW